MSESEANPTGALAWFSSDAESGPAGWKLDVVTLLAVIGESSVAEHSQTITASMLCVLPRIIPAPQALLRGVRPQRMPETSAKLTGVHSGVHLDTVGFFANIVHPLEDIPAYAFRAIRITHMDKGVEEVGDAAQQQEAHQQKGMDVTPRTSKTVPNAGFGFDANVESGEPEPITARRTMTDRVTDYIAAPHATTSPHAAAKRPAIPANLWSPVHVLAVFSFLLTVGILIQAGFYHDGTAILAITLISAASSVVGAASWWSPLLMNRTHRNQVPAGDVVIRTREGGFLLVRCTEDVARELYSGTEECKYRVGPRAYRALMGLGTFLLMVSVILLGNCSWRCQIFISAAYVTLNALYWAMGLLPQAYFWDLSRYRVEEITPTDSEHAEEEKNGESASFTRTLWYVVRETKKTAWVERSGAAPRTAQWKLWLAEARQAAEAGHRDWPAIARKDAIMKMSEEDIEARESPAVKQHVEPAEQHAPATEVQPGHTNDKAPRAVPL